MILLSKNNQNKIFLLEIKSKCDWTAKNDEQIMFELAIHLNSRFNVPTFDLMFWNKFIEESK